MGERALAWLQGGLESTKGTGVAASRILTGRITAADPGEKAQYLEHQRGSFESAYTAVSTVSTATLTLEQEATFEELPWFLLTGVTGGRGSSLVNTAAYKWSFAPFSASSNSDDLKAATIQWGDNDAGFRAVYAEIGTFTLGFNTLSGGGAYPLTFTANYLAKSIASNTRTAGLPQPSVEVVDASRCTFYIGTTSTGYDSLSALSGSLRQFEMNWDNGLEHKVTAGEGGVPSITLGRGKRSATFTMLVEGDTNGVTRFTEADTGTTKRIRLAFQGSLISGSSPATAREVRIDGRARFLKVTPLGEVGTNTVFSIDGQFEHDATLDAGATLTVINDVKGPYT